MIIKKYHSIMQREAEHRQKWAVGLTLVCSLLIFSGFLFQKGYLNFGNTTVAQKSDTTQLANVISADLAPSPIQSSEETIGVALQEIKKQYGLFLGSVSAVLVPFVTGIDVYERQ
jgi:hypothetical protein